MQWGQHVELLGVKAKTVTDKLILQDPKTSFHRKLLAVTFFSPVDLHFPPLINS